MRISFRTLGCKLNQAETDEMKTALLKKGFVIVPWGDKTDAVVIRGCAVTQRASHSTREYIRRAKRAGAVVVVVGCVENNDLSEIDYAAPSNSAAIKYLFARKKETQENGQREKTRDHAANRTRAFIKIQTGCAFNCAYCIITVLRGRPRSLSSRRIIAAINTAVKNGYQEVVLTGVNICLYQNQDLDLTGLLTEILRETTIPRLRLGSLDPRLITPSLIKLYTAHTDRLLPHWHLSVQSGADSVLNRMRRSYTAKDCLKIINTCRQKIPNFAFTTDIIVGFPGESDDEFKQTRAFVKAAAFAKTHIFPFSSRPGTAAALMPNPVARELKTARARSLGALAQSTAQAYARRFLGLSRPVLFENKKAGCWQGYTPEYIRVCYPDTRDLTNKIIDVKITEKNIK